RELFTGAGLRVNWIRSRTVLAESVVTHWLRRDPRGLPKLLRAELAAKSDGSLGAQLVISASKPRWPPAGAPGGFGGLGKPPTGAPRAQGSIAVARRSIGPGKSASPLGA